MMNVKLRDEIREFEQGVSLFDIAKSISDGLARVALCAKVNGVVKEMRSVLNEDAEVEFLTFRDEEGKNAYRHSTAHVLAQAVRRLYPDVKVAIGPAIATGFYYDFDFVTPITKADLEKIEAEMKKIIKANYPIIRKEITKEEALELFASEPYKVDLIENLPEDATISIYTQDDFTDLCAGPHIPSTGYVKAYKLTSVTGAYWRGDESKKMLTRIYGTSFDKKADLEEYLTAVEEAKKRDHNKIGRELGYFMTDENIGQGLPLLMPKGAKLFQILSRFIEDEEERRGYVRTKTPYMAKRELYKISGHWDHYRDGMFILGDPDAEGEVFALRPMTCPFQYTIYNNGLKSYRDLPIRYGETSTLFRNESSGEMHGLIRVRQFTISEGHLVCTPSQLEEEFKGCLELARYCLKAIGIDDDVTYRFSRWDPANTEKYINDPEKWEQAESEMERILKDLNVPYTDAKDEAAFYGPKLDIQIKNVYGKEDTLITIQIDMFLAENFDMSYIDENGEKKRPYIIHRTSIGCYERTMALILEKFAGALPTWLSPTQVKVLSLTERTYDDAKKCVDQLRYAGVRAEADVRNEKIGYKIREAQLEKVPYMIIIGDKEKENGVVAVRSRKEGDIGTMTLEEFIARINQEVNEKMV
ncbi:MAG: threonine--tRNA ligase [Clostridia bacterium]|nr:threonine--tRNA ligase [Clostridia bacterium]